MIRFLKRHVWPWAEIERLRIDRDAWRMDARSYIKIIDRQFDRAAALHDRLAKYERPRDENGRFTSNG